MKLPPDTSPPVNRPERARVVKSSSAPPTCSSEQAAILGVGKLQKRVVVRSVGGEDLIAIRPMAYVTLTIDHRVVDGHQTNAWMTRFVEILENWPERQP